MWDTHPMPARSRRSSVEVDQRDADANREKILTTAAGLMARRGHNVPLTEIAEAAGVGVATFYRRFPDRAALLDALQRRGYDTCLRILAGIRAEGLTGPDAIEAYLHRCHDVSDELVAMPLRGAEPLRDVEAVNAKKRIVVEIQELLDQGRVARSLHDDVSVKDVVVFSTLMATPLPQGPGWPNDSRHLITIFVRGIRNPDA
jgi:AcrR family transcriptional regulator